MVFLIQASGIARRWLCRCIYISPDQTSKFFKIEKGTRPELPTRPRQKGDYEAEHYPFNIKTDDPGGFGDRLEF